MWVTRGCMRKVSSAQRLQWKTNPGKKLTRTVQRKHVQTTDGVGGRGLISHLSLSCSLAPFLKGGGTWLSSISPCWPPSLCHRPSPARKPLRYWRRRRSTRLQSSTSQGKSGGQVLYIGTSSVANWSRLLNKIRQNRLRSRRHTPCYVSLSHGSLPAAHQQYGGLCVFPQCDSGGGDPGSHSVLCEGWKRPPFRWHHQGGLQAFQTGESLLCATCI